MRVLLAVVAALAAAACSREERPAPARAPVSAAAIPTAARSVPGSQYDAAFWKTWADGQAEMNGYDLVYPKYGQLRKGVAVAIFVTEPFSKSLRVKADPGRHAAGDEFPVMKLNLIRDYQTGVYDYNDMTSVFVSLAALDGRAAGQPSKVSFSSQEWCGHAYSQLLFHALRANVETHSYFDGEGDSAVNLQTTADTTAEDSLPLWARGVAWPTMGSGKTVDVPIISSLAAAREKHQPVVATRAALSAAPDTVSLQVPAGRFRVRAYTAKMRDGLSRTWWVETTAPHRLVRWDSSAGERAELLGSARMKYWELNREGGEKALLQFGLTRRPSRMP